LVREFSVYVLINYTQTDNEEEVLRFSRKVIEAKAEVVQLRVQGREDREFLRIARKIKRLVEKKDVLFIINNRLDIALAIDADGLHLGQTDLPVQVARSILGKKIIGKSTHSLEEALEAQKEGADYISAGPIFSSPTKPYLTPRGLGLLFEVRKKVSIPIVAIGGINLNNLQEIVRTGVRRVAVCSAIRESKDPKKTIERFRDILRD